MDVVLHVLLAVKCTLVFELKGHDVTATTIGVNLISVFVKHNLFLIN